MFLTNIFFKKYYKKYYYSLPAITLLVVELSIDYRCSNYTAVYS